MAKDITNKVISTMIKQGFISDPSISSPLRETRINHGALSPITHSPSSLSSTRFTSSPPVSSERTRSSPTLMEMMAEEREKMQSTPEKHRKLQERMTKILRIGTPETHFNSPDSGDVKLTVTSRDGFSVPMNVHRRILVGRSRFFAAKLRHQGTVEHQVDISDCDDIESYVETVLLMYCKDLRRKLMKQEVSKVLGLLKVSAEIMFDAGIQSCLEYLEAVPWSEDEEGKIINVLSQLKLQDPATEVLERVSLEASTSSSPEDIFLQLLSGVLQAKDDKARREMKVLVSGLLRENTSNNSSEFDVTRETLYYLCQRCLDTLLEHLTGAAIIDEIGRDRGVVMGSIAREADNLQWIVEILIERKIGDEFVRLWADQTELARLHSKVPAMYRFEISTITSQICIAVGRGEILVPKDVRVSLLQTWLDALYDDFGWMKRACRSMDKKLVEEGLSQTILTLPLAQQQAILLNWFYRFLNSGDDCPNIQRAFEIWWRRTFIRQYVSQKDQSHLQIALYD